MWHNLVQRPYEMNDPRALKLVKGILKTLMLRRTKETKDKHGRLRVIFTSHELWLFCNIFYDNTNFDNVSSGLCLSCHQFLLINYFTFWMEKLSFDTFCSFLIFLCSLSANSVVLDHCGRINLWFNASPMWTCHIYFISHEIPSRRLGLRVSFAPLETECSFKIGQSWNVTYAAFVTEQLHAATFKPFS